VLHADAVLEVFPSEQKKNIRQAIRQKLCNASKTLMSRKKKAAESTKNVDDVARVPGLQSVDPLDVNKSTPDDQGSC